VVEVAAAQLPAISREEGTMNIATRLALAGVALLGLSASIRAQESSYVPGTVWTMSYVKTEPGQFENYVDWLDKTWKKIGELGKKEGILVSYHLLQVNDARENEPDLILIFEAKDYQTNAQRLAFQKKMEAMLAEDPHQGDTKSGERKVMRKLAGGMELQELDLK
jgi:hypothetical protein